MELQANTRILEDSDVEVLMINKIEILEKKTCMILFDLSKLRRSNFAKISLQ